MEEGVPETRGRGWRDLAEERGEERKGGAKEATRFSFLLSLSLGNETGQWRL